MLNKSALTALTCSVALFLGANSANALLYSGDTTGGPLWTRPIEGQPPAAHSGLATGVPYDVLVFHVDTPGLYSFVTGSTYYSYGNFDTYLFLYEQAFDAAAPLVNVLIGNDDLAPPDTTQSGFTFSLSTDVTYFLVTTGYDSGDFGTFETRIEGAGKALTEVVPVPASLPLLASSLGALGIAAWGQRKRSQTAA